MTIDAKMTANDIRSAVAADASLKAPAIKVLETRFKRGSMKWRSLTTFAEFLGFTSEERATKVQLVEFITSKLGKPKASKAAPKAPKAPKASQASFAFVDDFSDRLSSLSVPQLKTARLAMGTLSSPKASPARSKGAQTMLRNLGLGA
tara:strand:+ start:41 stop:484 length:444 start_codon:yes stop_codon:yes gene_type:complete